MIIGAARTAILRRKTQAAASNILTISGQSFLLNGQPFKVWGVRVASASRTQALTDELLANLDAYVAAGINTLTVTYTGSSGEYSTTEDPYAPDGLSIEIGHRTRMEQIVAAADARGMVVMVNAFYGRAHIGISTATHVHNVMKTIATRMLPYRNVIIAPAGENDNARFSSVQPGNTVSFNSIYDMDSTANVGLLCADVHSIDPTRIAGAGGLEDAYNIGLGNNANVDVLLSNPGVPQTTTSLSHFNTFVAGGVNDRPNVNVEMSYSPTSGPAGVHPLSERVNYFGEVDDAKVTSGLSICFFAEPWQQDPDDIHYELGGDGTTADPGIAWFWDYVTTPGRLFTAASLQYGSYAGGLLYPLTLSAWVKLTTFTADQAVMGFGLTGSANRRAMLFCNTSTGMVGAQSRTDTGTTAQALSTAGPTAGVWCHVAAVFASATSRAAFFNGANKGSNATSIVSSAPTLFHIGATTIPSVYLNANLRQAAVWSVALSDAQIAQLAAGTSPLDIQSASLWGYWRMVGSSPETDSSANARHLTLTGF